MFIQHNNVYLMIASRQNCNAASLLLFLHRVIDVRTLQLWPFFSLVFVLNGIMALPFTIHCYPCEVFINFNTFCLCVQVFKHYFEELEEESLRDNFVVVVIDL